MAYSADSFVADEQPTTTKWNKLWNNDAALRDGSGVSWANNQAINAQNSGGTDKQVLKLGSNNYLRLGQIPFQTKNSGSFANVTAENVIWQAGWGQTVGDGVNSYIETTVTFPVTFDTLYGVNASLLPVKTSAPADITAFDVDYTTVMASASVAAPISTSGCNILLQRASGSFSATTYYGYSWIAWGIKS